MFYGYGKLMRHIKINSLKEIDEKKIVKLLKIVKKQKNLTQCIALL